jgi:hypothetical protein
MFQKRLSLFLLLTGIAGFPSGRLHAQEEEGEIVIISERVGKEIDGVERDQFELFQEVRGFQSAVLFKLPRDRYILKIACLNGQTGEPFSMDSPQSAASINNMRYHIDHFEELQTRKHATVETEYFLKPSTAFYVELLGKGFYSFNADFRKNRSKARGFGIQWVEDAFIPSLMLYFFKGNHFTHETGGGLSVVLTKNDGFAGLMIHGIIGYRYQKKNGPLFRIGFTPLVGIPLRSTGRFIILPWAGTSAGYCI